MSPYPSGSRVGPYEVLAPLGAGGMGEVVRARDTKLGREVAIKVLPAAFAQDAERVARFRREAQILASLNHPNIAAIYGLEEGEGVLALVMELVEGEDLAARLKRGAIPVDECVVIARQIAEALEEAHERGIVHRDLKPANVKVTAEGKVKVLDFGLAKAFAADPMASSGSHDLSQSPTLATAAGTQAGVILGTAAYMSPEQARGKAVDKRADIWAFGVVLFEMLTGQRLFRGDTASDTLAAVLREEIPWAALPAATPPSILRVLRRCLDRDPKRRLRDVGEARLAFEGGPEVAGAALDAAAVPSRGALWPWALGGLAIGAVLATALATRSPAASSAPQPLRLLSIPAAARPPNASQAISPDGRFVAYTAGDRLWIRNLAELEAREVTGSQGAHLPFWSPRSDAVAFAIEGALVKVRVDGDKLEELCKLASGRFTGGTWSETQGIVFTLSRANWDGEVLQVDAGGGQPRPFTRPAPDRRERRLTHPSFLPDGRTLLYTVVTRDANTGEVAIDQGGVRALLGLGDQSTEPSWSPTGHILFSRGRPPRTSLWALPFSLATLKATGEPFRVAASGGGASASATGSLLYGLPHPEPQQLVWVDRAGRVEGALGEAIDSNLQVPSLSLDGRRAAATVDWRGVMVWDTARGVATTLGGDAQGVAQPELSPDGERVIFARPGQGGIWMRRADGSDEPKPLVGKEASVGGHFSSDGAWLAFYVVDPKTLRDLWAVELAKPDQPFELLRTPANEALPRISPDGKLVAYQSDASGRWEVYVQPFPRGEGRWQVSSGGGQNPMWNPRGGELFFVSGDDLMAAPVTTGSSAGMNPAPALERVQVGAAQRLFSGSAAGSRLIEPTYVERHYAVAPDGRRFLLVKGSGQGRSELVLADGDWRRASTSDGR